MRELGYLPIAREMKYTGEYGQQSWSRPRQPGGAVEIHWDIVNSPQLRQTMSAGLDDLQPDGDGEAGVARPSPASMLLIGAVHAATSHGFYRLQVLCDVCQAARGAAGKIDTRALGDAIARTGSAKAVAAALKLAGANPALDSQQGRRAGIAASVGHRQTKMVSTTPQATVIAGRLQTCLTETVAADIDSGMPMDPRMCSCGLLCRRRGG